MTGAELARFGRTEAGEAVEIVTLARDGLSVRILTFGAVVQSVRLDGLPHDLTLGSGRLSDYEGAMRYHGALIAPVANRLGGGRAVVGGLALALERGGDRHLLHSGAAGTHRKVWAVDDARSDGVRLVLRLPDGEGGFPGERRVAADYSLPAPGVLRLRVAAETDRPTLFNAANHSYWNLDGSADWAGHELRIAADRYLPVSREGIPTGEAVAVADTDFDFRSGRVVAPAHPPLDHNFCLSETRQPLRPVLWLTGRGRLTMEVATTEPGVQVYDGRDAARPGRAGYEGLAIEAQGWPDAPNHAGFPSIELLPGTEYGQVTEWRFSRGRG